MELYRKAVELISAGRAFSVATVVDSQGSTPQKPGCKAILEESGRLWSTIGGGLVEADALERMRAAMADGQSQLYDFPLDEAYSRTAGPICGGNMRIFVDPAPARNLGAYQDALAAMDRRERGVLVTPLAGEAGDIGRAEWIAADEMNGADRVASAEDLRECLREESPRCVANEDLEVFIEPIVAPASLLIVGAGHIGQVLAAQATQLGFRVTVVDDRAEFAKPELFPEDTDVRCGDITAGVSAFPKDADTYIVIVTKGHGADALALDGCIHDEVAFLGLIGSERKVRLLRKHFIDDGLATEAEWGRMLAPIGYDIGAQTVPEIGVSIAAQLVAARRKREAVRGIAIKSLK